MSGKAFYTTEELQEHINRIYKRVKPAAERDGVYREISTKFKKANAGGLDGVYCYSDEDGYHLRDLERGGIMRDKITRDLFEITYWVINSAIFWMSIDFEVQHRIAKQDFRRIAFAKRLEYFAELGEDFRRREEYELGEILKIAPFHDESYQD